METHRGPLFPARSSARAILVVGESIDEVGDNPEPINAIRKLLMHCVLPKRS